MSEDNLQKVLDHGYVRLIQVMGDDTTVVNAARVSFDKRTEVLRDKDKRLIDYLARHDHTSPFRHALLQFEVYAPLMVARQWWKYVVGSDHIMDAWNESSRRYITEEPVFYIPDQWRKAPENKKQGSGDFVDPSVTDALNNKLRHLVEEGIRFYEEALAMGIAPEQARLFLPAYGMYVRWYWTASLQSVAHFLAQRLAEDAQWEIRQYAEAVKSLVEPHFPVSLQALLTYRYAPKH